MSDEVRPFPLTASPTAIRDTLALLDKKGVAILGGYDGETREPRLALAVKTGGDWSFGGYLKHTPSRKWKGEVAVMWTPGD